MGPFDVFFFFSDFLRYAGVMSIVMHSISNVDFFLLSDCTLKLPQKITMFLYRYLQKYVESSLGWAGERGEDSSYDSECDDDGGHRAASRTPSDTLAAEFAEYVTLAPPPPNQVSLFIHYTY